MHGVKTVRRPIAVTRDMWEDMPLAPRVRRAYEQTGNVTVVDIGEVRNET